jgi:IS5 family transposase
MEDVLIEVPKMRRFAGIALITDRIPDGTTILVFWHLLEENNFGPDAADGSKGLDGEDLVGWSHLRIGRYP